MRALISVSDKTNIVEFSRKLLSLGVEIISTGGTYKLLKESKLEVKEVSEITNFPECLDGRVKTLHPIIHSGILAIRSNEEHVKQLEKLNITPIDIVVVNLYPFKQTILKENCSLEQAIENIDIGGPTMLRAAAKNYQDVCVITSPEDYDMIIQQLSEGIISLETKTYLMKKVFKHTAAYDALISEYLSKDDILSSTLTLTYEKVMDLRYGENPHQRAAFYREIMNDNSNLTSYKQLNGKELSFNNINDTNGALELLKEFDEPTVVACKHGNPCGVASDNDIYEAWKKTYQADKISIFGGIVVFNRNVTKQIAIQLVEIFLEVIVAPGYEEEAITILSSKKNLRVLIIENISKKQNEGSLDIKKINGGIIVQSVDSCIYDELDFVTKNKPNTRELEDMFFGMKIVKYVKSNGIVIVKNKQTLGIGPGQVNRIWAVKQAIEHAKDLYGDENITVGATLASDAFFPFDDCVIEANKAKVACIIQPGGSIKDMDSINKCDEFGIKMAFSKLRHFRH